MLKFIIFRLIKMASTKEMELIGQILKETVRISLNENNMNQAIGSILKEISSSDVDTYVLTHPDLTYPLYKNSQKAILGAYLESSSQFDPTVNMTPKMTLDSNGNVIINYTSQNKFDPVKHQDQVTETLKGLSKKLPMVIDETKMTQDQIKLIRQIKYNCIKKRFITSTGMSAGLSLIFNIGDLIKGNFTNYAINAGHPM